MDDLHTQGTIPVVDSLLAAITRVHDQRQTP